MPVDPFSFDPPSSLFGRAVAYAARPVLLRLLGLKTLGDLYAARPTGPDDTFVTRALETLGIGVDVGDMDLGSIPPRGPVIVAANHPRGAVDGMALLALVGRRRADVRLLANHLLARIPELRSACFFVDPFEGPTAAARSRAGLRAAHLWLRNGGALIVFPAGEVAHERGGDGRPVDRAWPSTIGRLAVASGAQIVPAFIDGGNSRAFYAAGRVHPILRTALLPRELLHARGRRIAVRFGPTVVPASGEFSEDKARAIARDAQTAVDTLRAAERSPSAAEQSLIVEEVGRLSGSLLIDAGRFRVVCACAADIPATLREIGRLRAVTYRAAGEGTGTEVDLDRFDEHYLHLFVWDQERRQVVGAYRLGRSDRIVRAQGVDGLYTRTLFRYDRRLIDALSPALELGRSFVRPEYQKNYQALLLLWKGIGRWIAAHPQYRRLFGPVSISGRYRDASHQLLQAFLEQNHFDHSLATLVSPLHPRPTSVQPGECAVPSSVADVDSLVTHIESDGKGMPVLLRQYLKLNARALGFSVDASFGDVVDALMTVDLASVDQRVLHRYLGDELANGWGAAA